MKEDSLYPLYIIYLESKMNTDVFGKKISKSQFAIFRLSSSSFTEFKDRYEEDELFQKKVIKVHKSEIRDKKIDDIFDDLD